MKFEVAFGVFLIFFFHVHCAIIPSKLKNNGKAGLQNFSTSKSRIYLGESSDAYNTIVASPLKTAMRKKLCDQCRNEVLCRKHGDCRKCSPYCETYETDTRRSVGEMENARNENENEELTPMENEKDPVVSSRDNVNSSPQTTQDANNDRQLKEKPNVDTGRKSDKFKEGEYQRQSHYYTLGALNQGKALNILLKMSNIEKTEAVDKAVILIKSHIPLKFDERLLERIGDRAFLKIFEKELTTAEKLKGTNHLNNEEIDHIIHDAAKRVHHEHKGKGHGMVGMEHAENDTVGCSKEESEVVPFFPLPPPNLYRSHSQQGEHRQNIPFVEQEEAFDRFSSKEESRAKNPGVIQAGLNMRNGGNDIEKSKQKQTDRARQIIDTISHELKGLENMNFVSSPNVQQNSAIGATDEQEPRTLTIEHSANQESNQATNENSGILKGLYLAPNADDEYYNGDYIKERTASGNSRTDDDIDNSHARSNTITGKGGSFGTASRNHEESGSITIPETDIKLDKKKFLSARPDLDSHNGLPKEFHDGIHAHFKKIQEAHANELINITTERNPLFQASTVQYADEQSEESDEQDLNSPFNRQRSHENDFPIVSAVVGTNLEPTGTINLKFQNEESEDADGSFENINARRGQGGKKNEIHLNNSSIDFPIPTMSSDEVLNTKISKLNSEINRTQQGEKLDEKSGGKSVMEIDNQLNAFKGKSPFQDEESSREFSMNGNQFNNNNVVGDSLLVEGDNESNVGELTLTDPQTMSSSRNFDSTNAVSTNPKLPVKIKIKPNTPVSGKIQSSAPAYSENRKFEVSIPNIVSSPMNDPITVTNFEKGLENDKSSVVESIEKLITPQEQEFLHNFGKIVPAAENMNLDSDTPVYFMGNGIKLPLKVSQNEDGSLSLSVDIEKLCKCKNSTCIHKKEMMERLDNTLIGTASDRWDSEMLENKNGSNENRDSIEKNNRKTRHHKDYSKSKNHYKNHNKKYHSMYKRNVNIENEGKISKLYPELQNAVIKESSDEIGFHDVKDMRKFTQKAEELEKKLEQLNIDVQKSNKHYDNLFQKGAEDFLPVKDKDQIVKQRIELVNDFLNWLRNMTESIAIVNGD